MARRNTTYQYGSGDDPLTVANQFNVTPQALLAANPGGSPFNVGQTINIPFQYSAPAPQAVQQYAAPIGPQPPTPATSVDGGRGSILRPNGQLFEDGSVRYPQQPYAVTPQGNNLTNFAMRGRGYTPTPSSTYGTDDSWYRPATPAGSVTTPGVLPGAQAQAFDPTKPYGGFERASADNTDYANTAIARFHEAAGTPFLNQMRWDPQRRRYVSIGRLLRQGKLDLKGNWHKRSNRQRQNDNASRKQQQQTKQQDMTLGNSLIQFSASSG